MDLLRGPVTERTTAPANDAMRGRAEWRLATSLLEALPKAAALEAVLPVLGRGCNHIFRVCTAHGDYALKIYGPPDGSAPERCRREVRALRFLAQGSFAPFAPRLLVADMDHAAVLLEWIDGELPVNRRGGEVVQLQRAMQSLLAISRGAEAADFPPAPSACPRPAELARQIEARRDRFSHSDATPGVNRLLNQFDTLWPIVRSMLQVPQDPARLVLSPGDFGFHRSLRRGDGTIMFLAYEDFGWDDPARLVADLLWHPSMVLSLEEIGWIWSAGHAVFGVCDGGYARRFARISPAIGLRWALNRLELVLPEHPSRVSGTSMTQAAIVKQRALEQATTFMERVRANLRDTAA